MAPRERRGGGRRMETRERGGPSDGKGEGERSILSPATAIVPHAVSSSHAVLVPRFARREVPGEGNGWGGDAEECCSSSVHGEGSGEGGFPIVGSDGWGRGIDGPSTVWHGIGWMQDDKSPHWNGGDAWACNQGQPGCHPNRTRSPIQRTERRRTKKDPSPRPGPWSHFQISRDAPTTLEVRSYPTPIRRTDGNVQAHSLDGSHAKPDKKNQPLHGRTSIPRRTRQTNWGG